MIDDSALFHGTYDPVKAREYYLRTRKLKGRHHGDAPSPTPRVGGAHGSSSGGKPNRADTKSRRAELQAQKERLQKRLDHLREVLEKKVKDAKALSDKNAPKPKKATKGKKTSKTSKGTAPETKADVADRGKEEKSKTLTSTQKAHKAKQAKEAYEKEHPNSLSNDVEILKLQVQDIRSKIQKAVSDAAQARHQKAGGQNSSMVRPRDNGKPNDGPRGR